MNNIIELTTSGVVETQDGREFTRLMGGFGEDKPTITDKQVAELLGYKLGARQVRQVIERNKDYFTENDIIDLKIGVADCNTLGETLQTLGYAKQSITQAKNIYLFSQAGFLLFLKFAEGSKAVELYKNFIEDYFKTKAENEVMKMTIQEEIEELNEKKAMLLGKMFMSPNADDKINFFNESEDIGRKISKLENTLTKENVIQKLQPKLDVIDRISSADNCYNMSNVSKVLNIEGLGRNNFFKWLREENILRKNNEPYQQFMKYFKVVMAENNGFVSNVTLLNFEGIEYIIKRLTKKGLIVSKSIEEIIAELDSVSQ